MKALAIAVLMALPLVAIAKDNPDQSFFHKAAEAGHAEVQAGQVAERKAKNGAVKEFAAMMVKEHTAANLRLGTIAGTKGVALPTGPSREQKAVNGKVEKKSHEAFDRDYIQGQIQAHEDTIALLQKEISQGRDAEAKAFATETLPTVQAHLARIKEIAASSTH